MNSKEYYKILHTPLQEKDDTSLIYGGGIFLVLFVVINFIPIELALRMPVLLVIVFISVFWAIHRAEILNRNKIIWGICAFIFPPITLIILGLMGTKIGIKPIKKLVYEHRKKYEEKILNNKLPEKDAVALNSKIYTELSAQLKKDISSKFNELNIEPDSEPNQPSSPSRFTIWIGGLTTSLSATKSNNNTIIKARNGYIFNFIILILIIAVLIYVIIKS